MFLRLYFGLERFKMDLLKEPTRVSVHHDPDKAAGDVEVLCEVSANGLWGDKAQWTNAPEKDVHNIIWRALVTLISRRDSLRKAIGMAPLTFPHRFSIPVGENAKLTVRYASYEDEWNLGMVIDGVAQPESAIWKSDGPGKELFRIAVVRLVRDEVALKEIYGLKPAARFEDLLAAARTGAERRKALEEALKSGVS
ncbi:MAG TPA: hypothetical protein V6D17_19710 [Candidatus Obscuribacterales bacterium]